MLGVGRKMSLLQACSPLLETVEQDRVVCRQDNDELKPPADRTRGRAGMRVIIQRLR
jgi:hypothetical protein